MATRIQLRRGTAAQWETANPILAEGEFGLETDTGKRKIGDGVTAWADLPYDVSIEDVTALTPGPGEVIVGGEGVPVRRQLSWTGMELQITDLESLVPAGDWHQDTWTSYDGENIIVHPSIRYFPEPFSGYHWWAAATPYAGNNVLLENPCVYVSEDGKNWVDAPGVSNPLIDATGIEYNSDPYLTQDHNGRLLLYYREQTPTHSAYRLFTSVDGVTWDGPTTVQSAPKSESRLLSASVWWEAREQKWVMLGTEGAGSTAIPYSLSRYTCSTPDGMFVADATQPTISPEWATGWRSWHLDVLPMGNQLIGVMMAYDENPPAKTYNFLMSSDDGGRTWTRLEEPLPEGGHVYKAAIVPLVTERGAGLHVWQGRGAPQYNTRSVQLLPPSTKDMIALQPGIEDLMAWNGIYPYVLGDNFNRPDDNTGLGVASSGQEWTTTLGTPIVAGGKASGVGNSRAVIDVGHSDYEISARIESTPGTSGATYFIARYGGSSSLIRCGITSSTVVVQKIDGGSPEAIIPNVGLPSGIFTIALRCKGDTFTLLIDGVETGSVTDAFNVGATEVGVNTNAAKPLDDLKVKVI